MSTFPNDYEPDRELLIRDSQGNVTHHRVPRDISRIESAMYESYNHRYAATGLEPSAFLIPAYDYLLIEAAYRAGIRMDARAFSVRVPEPYEKKPKGSINFLWRGIPVLPVECTMYSTAVPLQAVGKYVHCTGEKQGD